MPAKKKRPRKRTSQRVSRLAAEWLAYARSSERDEQFAVAVPTGELKAICASVLSQDLSQDEQRGAR